jgi:hypothetical protein
MTILPLVRPVRSRVKPSLAFSKGRTVSLTTLIFPSATHCPIWLRCSAFEVTEAIENFRLVPPSQLGCNISITGQQVLLLDLHQSNLLLTISPSVAKLISAPTWT